MESGSACSSTPWQSEGRNENEVGKDSRDLGSRNGKLDLPRTRFLVFKRGPRLDWRSNGIDRIVRNMWTQTHQRRRDLCPRINEREDFPGFRWRRSGGGGSICALA